MTERLIWPFMLLVAFVCLCALLWSDVAVTAPAWSVPSMVGRGELLPCAAPTEPEVAAWAGQQWYCPSEAK